VECYLSASFGHQLVSWKVKLILRETKQSPGVIVPHENEDLYIHIVTATWKEPVAGWVDNVNGPTGLIAACGKGILRTLLCHRTKIADLIPLDFPVNLILAAAWYTASAR